MDNSQATTMANRKAENHGDREATTKGMTGKPPLKGNSQATTKELTGKP